MLRDKTPCDGECIEVTLADLFGLMKYHIIEINIKKESTKRCSQLSLDLYLQVFEEANPVKIHTQTWD